MFFEVSRIIYHHFLAAAQIALLLIYPKSGKDDLTPAECKALKQLLNGGGNNTMSTFFDELLESVQQMDEIVKGERVAARDFHVDAFAVKDIRKSTGLTQDTFAQHIGIEVLHCVTGNKGDVSQRGLLRHC